MVNMVTVILQNNEFTSFYESIGVPYSPDDDQQFAFQVEKLLHQKITTPLPIMMFVLSPLICCVIVFSL